MVSLPFRHQYLTTLYRLSEGFVGGPDSTDVIPCLAVRPIMQLVSPPVSFYLTLIHTNTLHRTHGTALKHPPPTISQRTMTMTHATNPPPQSTTLP